MLDFQYKLTVLELCDTCWFTLHDIDVKDERMVRAHSVTPAAGLLHGQHSSGCSRAVHP